MVITSYIERIREARKDAGLTQAQLAELVGVGKTTITGYEKGNREMSAAMVAMIAKATGASIEFIFQDEIREQEGKRRRNEKEDALISHFRELNEEGQDTALNVVTSLAASGLYKKIDPAGLGAEEVG